MNERGLKTISLEEITDKHIGKRGTPKREAFENELRLDLLGEHHFRLSYAALSQTGRLPNETFDS